VEPGGTQILGSGSGSNIRLRLWLQHQAPALASTLTAAPEWFGP